MPEWRCQRRTGKPRRQQPSFANGILCGFVDPASNSFSFSFPCERVTSFIYTIIHIAHYHFSLTSFFSSSGCFVFSIFCLFLFRHGLLMCFCFMCIAISPATSSVFQSGTSVPGEGRGEGRGSGVYTYL